VGLGIRGAESLGIGRDHATRFEASHSWIIGTTHVAMSQEITWLRTGEKICTKYYIENGSSSSVFKKDVTKE
jgi:hypothetical protein